MYFGYIHTVVLGFVGWSMICGMEGWRSVDVLIGDVDMMERYGEGYTNQIKCTNIDMILV